MRPKPSERYSSKLPRKIWINSFACIEQILWNFKVYRTNKIIEHFLKKIRRGPDLPGLGRGSADPAQIQREGRRGRGVWTCPWARLVSGTGVPNRYRASSAVRSSCDRRPTLVVYAEKSGGGGNPRVSPGSCGAHRGAAGRRGRVGGGCGGS
jgi:hypothetical protein